MLTVRIWGQGGVNYTLTDVNWIVGNTTAIDYSPIGEYYTANAIYSASISTTKVTGYTVTANYSGEVGFTNTDIILYEAIFLEVRHLAQIITPASAENKLSDSSINNNISIQNSQDIADLAVHTLTDEQINAENEKIQGGTAVMREISIDELSEFLRDGGLQAQGKLSERQEATHNSWKSFAFALMICTIFLFRKGIKNIFSGMIGGLKGLRKM